MELVINNKIIDAKIETILQQLKLETHGNYLHVIGTENNDNVKITCPFHKDGKESHPSCFVYSNRNGDVEYGYYKCFTCGSKGHLYDLVSYCLDIDVELSKKWLVKHFSNTFLIKGLELPIIDLHKEKISYLDESILKPYAFYHPYLEDRGISFETAKRFQVGWNQEHNSITFPVWDRYGRLVGITERYINEKRFYIPQDLKKPVYLLNEIIYNNYKTAFIVESQINALTLWEWGYPSIALFGTGSKEQYEILKTSGIRKYYLCFDGDEAGHKGANRFIKYMPKDVLITTVNIPNGKDVNNLTKEEFENILLLS